MKKNIFIILIISTLLAACKEKSEWTKIRESDEAQALLYDIKKSKRVDRAIIDEAGGLNVAMYIYDTDVAKQMALYYLSMAKAKKVKIKYCVIISAYKNYKYSETYMGGLMLAFENQWPVPK